uniref:Prominin-1-A n=1 Tax=Magallana gigas TaxID=29159 RepID=K1R0F5_MAGGI
MGRVVRHWTGIVILLAWINLGYCDDPVLTPATLTDSGGNTANANSSIKWAPLPSFDSYKAGDIEYDSSGLAPLNNFAKSFINGAVFPLGVPWDLMEKAIDGTLMTDITANYMNFGGYGACIVIGFLFIFIFPLIGLCFCCCRCCCSNCGGKMMQHNEDVKADCKRRTFAIILFVLIAFTGAGMICVYLSNDQMSTALNNFDDVVVSNMDDLTTYASNVVKETKYIVNTNFNFTTSVITRDLDRVTQIAAALTTLNTTLGDVKVKAEILSSNLTTLKTDIDTAITSAGCPGAPNCPDTSGVVMGFDTNDFPDISGPLSSISSVENQNLSAIIIQASSEIENIPERVTNETRTTVSDLKTMVSNFSGEIDPLIEQVENIQDSISTNGTIADIKKQVKDMVDVGSTYDKYRWYGGVGLTSIVLLVVLLQILGLGFGTCSQNSNTRPTERGCVGTSAGKMLMALWTRYTSSSMVLRTAPYLVKCSLTTLALTLGSANFCSSHEANDTLVSGSLHRDCQGGAAAFKALKLNNLFDVSTLTNFTKSEVDKINIDLSTVKIMTPSLLDQLNEMKNAINVNFTKFREELGKSTTGQNMSALADQLDTLAGSCSPGCNAATQTSLRDLATRTRSIESNELANLTTALTQLGPDLNTLESTVNGTDTDVDNCINNFNISEIFVQNNGSDVVKNEAKKFADRIIGIVTSFADDALYALDNEIGKCTPIWNLYNTLFVISLCQYTVDSLNGFWFSLGWCIFFFIPSIIFSTKLAKHYRRMSQLDNDYEDDKDELQLPEVSSDKYHILHNKVHPEDKEWNGSKSPFGSNKVGHYDPSSAQSNPPPYNTDW